MFSTLIFSLFLSLSPFTDTVDNEVCMPAPHENTCIRCDNVSCSATIDGRMIPRDDTELCIGTVCAHCWHSKGGYGCQIGTGCKDSIDSCEHQCYGGVIIETGPHGGCS